MLLRPMCPPQFLSAVKREVSFRRRTSFEVLDWPLYTGFYEPVKAAPRTSAHPDLLTPTERRLCPPIPCPPAGPTCCVRWLAAAWCQTQYSRPSPPPSPFSTSILSTSPPSPATSTTSTSRRVTEGVAKRSGLLYKLRGLSLIHI